MIFLCVALSLRLVHLSLEGEMEPVTHQNLGYPRSVFLHLPHPPVHPLEAPLVGDVVDEEDALGAPAVAADDGAEPALAARVPDLQFDSLPVYEDCGGLVGRPCGAAVYRVYTARVQPREDLLLADVTVSHQEDL